MISWPPSERKLQRWSCQARWTALAALGWSLVAIARQAGVDPHEVAQGLARYARSTQWAAKQAQLAKERV